MNPLRKPPRWCQIFEDRHGRLRCYYRRPGFPRVPLPGLPWSPEFMAAYEAAAKGEPLEVGKNRSSPGTINALIASYYRSGDYRHLSDATKTTYRGIIERFRTDHGHRIASEMTREHVQRIINKRSDTPAAANNLLSLIKLLSRHGLDIGMLKTDPTQGVRKIRHKSGGFRTWEEEHITAFVEHHKPGTRAHLALMLLLYTGQRRSDVVRMGWQDVSNGVLFVAQQKTGQEVHIPILPDLQAVLDGLPADAPAFLLTARGEPFTPAGFTNWFGDVTREAGLPAGLSPHGLRKATCRRLAEGGCTPHQIMAISGHKSLAEVTRYTVAAGRKELAAQAMLAFGKKEE